MRAVRALGDELRRRRTEEDAAGLFLGRESVSLEARVFQALFEALTGERVGAFGVVGAVRRAEAAARAVERYWEARGVPETDRDIFPLWRLADVLREVPGALWAPEVAAALELVSDPGIGGPEIAVIRRDDGSCAVLNVGSRPTTYGEWLRFSSGSHANAGKALAAWTDDEQERGRCEVAAALRGLVERRTLSRASRGWRPATARALYLESFWSLASGTWDYAAFSKETGIPVNDRWQKAAFRKHAERTFREALGEVVAVTTPAVELSQRRAESLAHWSPSESTKEGRKRSGEETKGGETQVRGAARPGRGLGRHAAGADSADGGGVHDGSAHREGSRESTARGRRPGVPPTRTPDSRKGALPEGRPRGLPGEPPRSGNDHRRADPRRGVRGRRVKEPP